MKRTLLSSLIMGAAFLSACQYQMPADHSTQDKIQDTLRTAAEQNKATANAAQVKKPVDDGNGVNKRERFNVSAHGLPAREFFSSLVAGTSENIVISPDVTGLISMDLKNVTVPEALAAVRDSYGYGIKRTAYGWQIMPQQQQTQIFRVNYLNVKRSGLSDTRVSSGQISSGGNTYNHSSSSETSREGSSGNSGSSSSSSANGESNITTLNSAAIQTETDADFWKDLEKSLHLIVKDGEGKEVVVNAMAGVVVVRGMPEDIRAVREFLDASQIGMQRQVVLEAKILEVELNDGFQAGINWQAVGEPGDGKTI
ncbi:MAG TPA: secretin N-terminal domain-containing protein, partial [Pseudomonadales bacterium]|nr:secretin N-terminal domain-containing protein [Pseudomonadales bacterium]